ncbi:MAG: sodium:phosphate symporter [Halobacteriovorax sp.]|nr:sodium:phosphate symporter [Halobacteriovorax sp.]|tara:strand:- start:89266 stop:90924 length:1659 start_codon:yes stop_codon:yes gene_type:complete
MDLFKMAYTVLGGLGIFFFGMKSMSEALQSAAGDVIKKAIDTITKHRIYSVMVGVVVTMIVQSSSVTTVMVVGFVNAGLMNLTQAIGVIFGANIGTTITGWIISVKVGKYGLLFIALGIFPLLFGKSHRTRQIGKIFFGIGMIFYGLTIMSDAFKPLRTMPEFLEMVSYFSEPHYGSYAACILVGCVLTMIIQSSSAMLGITIAMAASGVIGFQTAAALVLGENIGTTITALLASVGANITAKRAARAHAIFNSLGVLVIFIIFPYYLEMVDWLVPGDPNFINEAGDKPNIAVHIATGHSIFNVTATLLFLPFLNHLARLVTRLTPDKGKKEQHHLEVLGDPRDLIPATALAQAEAEVAKMKDIVNRQYDLTGTLLRQKTKQSPEETLIKIRDYEQITDNIQKEITVFLVKFLENSLTSEESNLAQSLMREADELESVSDYLERIAKYTTRTPIHEILTEETKKEFFSFYDEVESFYHGIAKRIKSTENMDLTIVHRKSEELRQRAQIIRKNQLQRVTKGKMDPLTSLTYSDLVVAVRKIRSHAQNIAEAHV